MYDITHNETFDRVDNWLNELKEFADKNIVIYVVGNKSDQENHR